MQINFLNPSRCALLVVDIQDRLMPVIEGKECVTRNSILLLKAAKTLQLPIIATTQYAARIGDFLPEVKTELEGITPIDKMEFGGFNNPLVRQKVEQLPPQVDTLIICGVETHICIYQTVLGALRAGYSPWVPADAVSSRTHLNHSTGLGMIRDIGGIVANTELIIYELLHQAGTPAFKALLPFLK